ncbi:MAG: OmpH family outer membrane protein [Holosporales bacterium]|jgi:Skp family chaperone for outer membrane proteins|nr:OmpH family outer membrane protein [Holosporales bacterium]
MVFSKRLIVLVAFFVVCANAEAVDFPVGVLDLTVVQAESVAMNSIKSQADKLRQKYQEEVANLEDQLRNDYADLAKSSHFNKSNTPNSEDKLEKKYKDLYAITRSLKHQWETSVGDANKKFHKRVTEVVKKIAESKGLVMVVNKDALVFSKKEIDITKEVVVTLNKEMPYIAVVPVAAVAE